MAPTLILAPLTLLAFYKLLGVDLMFPLTLFSSLPKLIEASFVPAIILFLASGLAGRIFRNLRQEQQKWREKNFYRFAKATGKSPEKALRPLVLKSALLESWNTCLPWVFGELVIVECMFNAPGLGFDTWRLAKERRLDELGAPILVLAALYFVLAFLGTLMAKRLGKRLESYQ